MSCCNNNSYTSLPNEIGGNSVVSSLTINDTTPSTSTDTGAIIIAGGAGIGDDTYIGGALTITDTTASNDTTSGALIVSGGAGIGGDVNIGGTLTVGGVPISGGTQVAISTATATTSTSSIDIELTGGYSMYIIDFIDCLPAAGTVGLWMRTSTDGGSTFDEGATDYEYHNERLPSDSDPANARSTGDTKIVLINSQTANTEDGSNGRIYVYDPSDTTHNKMFSWDTVYRVSAVARAIGAGERSATTDVDHIRLLYASGNFARGTVRLYGIN